MAACSTGLLVTMLNWARRVNLHIAFWHISKFCIDRNANLGLTGGGLESNANISYYDFQLCIMTSAWRVPSTRGRQDVGLWVRVEGFGDKVQGTGDVVRRLREGIAGVIFGWLL